MKRRNFFGALLGAAATPVIAKAIEALPAEPETVVITKRALGPEFPEMTATDGTTMCSAMTATNFSCAADEWDHAEDDENEDEDWFRDSRE